LTSPQPPFQPTEDEKNRKKKKTEKHWPMAYISRHTRPMTATSGFRDSPGSPSLGDALGTVLVAHRQGHRNGQQVWYFFVIFLSRDTAICPGQYGPNTRLMTEFSGFV
jgi:hypothetical protein